MPELTPKSAYFRLMADTCDLMPKDAVNTAIQKHGSKIDVTRAKNVVDGMTKDLPLLILIVEAAIPGFHIEQEIRNAA